MSNAPFAAKLMRDYDRNIRYIYGSNALGRFGFI